MMKSGLFDGPEPHPFALNIKTVQNAFNICQEVLKSTNLLHKQRLGDSQSPSTVYILDNFDSQNQREKFLEFLHSPFECR